MQLYAFAVDYRYVDGEIAVVISDSVEEAHAYLAAFLQQQGSCHTQIRPLVMEEMMLDACAGIAFLKPNIGDYRVGLLSSSLDE